MKAHRWYSALSLMSLIGLMALPLAFFAGVFFPFRSEAEISRRQTFFGWLVGALFGTVVAFGSLILCAHYMSCPSVPDEQLFAYAQESVDRVSTTRTRHG